MSWRAITEADVLIQISGPELSSIRAAVLGQGQADPVQPTIDQVTVEVRGYVAGNPKNQVGADGTVPQELIGHAVALIVMRLMPRAAGLVIGESRQKAAEEARQVLRDVAGGKLAIAQPTNVTTEVVSGGGVEMATTPTRVATREKLSGL